MKKTIMISALVLVLASCSKERMSVKESNVIAFNIHHPEMTTKATASSFEAGDALSLYAVEYAGGMQQPLQVSGNYLNNERLSYNGSAWAGSRTLYYSANNCDFYGLYPYQGSISSVGEYPFTVIVNQNADDGYENSDLLYAMAEDVAPQGTVNLQFRHMMSKVVVNLIKGSKFEGEIPDDIVTHIYNTNTECTVNLTTGSVEKSAFGAKRTITMKKISNERFEAVVVPQNLEKRTPLVEITMGGIAYLLEYSMSFRPGYVYNVNVTLNTSPDQEQIEISIDPEQQDWN